jgi:hypothetical protein
MAQRLPVMLWMLPAVAAAMGALLTAANSSKTPLRARYEQVKKGMTEEEAHAIMDHPYSMQRWPSVDDQEVYSNVQFCGSWVHVVPPEGREFATIEFKDGIVTGKSWGDPFEPGYWHRLLNRLGLSKRLSW